MRAWTLDQLLVFVAVVEHGGFSAAARRLHRTQAAVSYAVATLEEHLDVRLFDRSSYRPLLTPDGEVVLAEARAVLARAGRLEAVTRAMGEGVEPRIVLLIDVMFPTNLLMGALGGLTERFPGVAVDLRIDTPWSLRDHLAGGRGDLAVAAPLFRVPAGWSQRFLRHAAFRAVCAPSHPLAQCEGPIPSDELKAHVQLVLSDREPSSEDATAALAGGPVWRMTDLATRHACVRAGLGWCYMPEEWVEADLASGKLVAIEPPTGAVLRNEFHAFHPTDRPPGPAGRWVLEELGAGGMRLAAAPKA